jgi:poly(hydroxyalkanoate) synthase III subunit E
MSRARALYDRFEQVAGPIAIDVTHSSEYAQVVALTLGVQKSVRSGLNRLAAQAWHTVNLPAGTDVQRLRVQVGALNREIRLLTLELARQRAKD